MHPTKHTLDDAAVDELKRLVKGTVHRPSDSGFTRHSQLFNAAIRSDAQLLVRPLDTHDVSEVVKFCTRHALTPSVKSGGYGTHGWAVEGDVIIDMRLIAQITMERPLTEPDKSEWTSLRDQPHATVSDPDTLKGKAKAHIPSAVAFPTAYPSGNVGPPPIHAPFTDPKRRSADEAFSPADIKPKEVPEDSMHVDGEDPARSSSGEGSGFSSGSGSGSERPTRRPRVTSPSSDHTSLHPSATSTPGATGSPHTPADELAKPSTGKSDSVTYDSLSQAENHKSRGPATADEVEHDEGLLPPSSERPGVGVDIRGFVGRDVGGWDTVWQGQSTQGIAAESVGVTFSMADPARMGGMGPGMGAGMGMGASSWLWAPPAGANLPPSHEPILPRSNAPSTARPFDFSDSTQPSVVNAFVNPHAAPPPNPVFAGTTGASTARPFDFLSNFNGSSTATPSANTAPDPGSPPQASSSGAPLPRVTHVEFAPAVPVSHTYVTFGAGACQKDIDAFCAAHPLAAVMADGAETDAPPTLVADTAQPDLYERPAETGFGPGSGSFFAPGMSGCAGLGMGMGGADMGFSQPSLFAPPASNVSPRIPYFVPFAAHPVGSTVMLLGGFGFLSRLHGLSMDCLVEAEVVLSDGRIVWVSEQGVKDEDGNVLEEVDGGEGWEDEGETFGEPADGKMDAKVDGIANTEHGDQALVQDTKPVDGEGSKGKKKDRSPTPKVDEKEKEDKPRPVRGLWWALRGAGSAFGIVVRYKAKAFPVPIVFAGNLIYNFNKLTAASLIKHFRDCIKAAPRELYANCILTAGPKGKGALVVIQICYAGSRAEGLPFLQAISSWEGENCLLNEVQEKEFVWQQDSVAKVLKGGSGRKWFIRSDLISSLTDEIIHRTVRKFGDTPNGCTWLFELSGGALVDREDTCLPKVAREATFTIVALHQWKLEEDDPACVLTAEEWIKDSLASQSTGGPFPCFLERREKRTRILGVYGRENWARLCALKKKYDPNGMFRHNFWPLDEAGRPIVDPKLMKPGAEGEKTIGHAMDLTLDDRGVPR